MLSRVAENLYWMARYIERAEDTARLISVTSHLMLDLPRRQPLGWSAMIDITGGTEAFAALYDERNDRNVVQFLCADRRNPGSILSALAEARENLRTTRDVVPREVWEEVNQLYMGVGAQAESGLGPGRRDVFLKQVTRGCQALTGLIEGTLSHGMPRTFMTLGRQLERADMTTRIIDVRSGNLLPRHPDDILPFEHLQWMSVLKSLTAYQMYRQHVRLRVRATDVLTFLLQDAQLPRAVSRSLKDVARSLRALPRHDRALAAATLVHADVAEADVKAMVRSPEVLHEFIDTLQVGLGHLHDAIARTYFPTPWEALSEPEAAARQA
ncbi:alpha-E domain-containing protein [Halomonas sp. V046]|uniref:alpha-E domain-containing protein n=1 Tax=Halomonas sp. V046 TaxID=3459611 RepID=UPI0040444EB8